MAISPQELATWRRYLRSHLRLIEQLDRDLRQSHDLPLSWYDVLVQLEEAGEPVVIGDLARRLLISPSNCTRLVDRLVRSGLVERLSGLDPDDGRVKHVNITELGRDQLRAAAPTHLRGVEDGFTSLLSGDQQAVARFLGRVNDRLT